MAQQLHISQHQDQDLEEVDQDNSTESSSAGSQEDMHGLDNEGRDPDDTNEPERADIQLDNRLPRTAHTLSSKKYIVEKEHMNKLISTANQTSKHCTT